MKRLFSKISVATLTLLVATILITSVLWASEEIRRSNYDFESKINNVNSIDSCCQGATGNVDNQGGVDIADLTFLINHLYINFPDLPCPEEANIDGDGGIDIADLTALIDHLYINFPPTSTCPGIAPVNATYIVTFESVWSSTTHPDSYPSNSHFSGLVGGTHNANANFWIPGQLSSIGIKEMAEFGSKTKLINEIQAAITAGNAEVVISGGGIGSSPGSVNLSFNITSDFPLVSLVSMLAPSPDWFIGVHDLPLFESSNWLDSVVVTLYAFDSGTDDGIIYTSANSVTSPPDSIFQIMVSPFLVGSEIPPIGTFTFVRQ